MNSQYDLRPPYAGKCFDEATGKLLASGAENKGMEKLNSSPLTIHLKKCSMFIYTQFWRLELAL